jgi:hypothetical protein
MPERSSRNRGREFGSGLHSVPAQTALVPRADATTLDWNNGQSSNLVNDKGDTNAPNSEIPTKRPANLDSEFPHWLNLRRAPLLSGQWLVLVQCTCRGVTFEVVQGLIDEERILQRLACSGRAAGVKRTFFNSRRPQTALIEALGGSPRVVHPHGRAWTDPDERVDQRLVTFDARLHPLPGTRTTVAAEVGLTSGGWVRVARVKNPDYSEAAAQVRAAVAAMAMFPHGSSVTLLCPSHKTATAVRSAQTKTRRFNWIPKELYESLSSYVDSREVHVLEPPRASTALMRTATTLVDECAEESWEASTSPLLDWVQTEGIPVTKPARETPRLTEKRRPRHGRFR